jgi:hypothetical protein
MSLQAAREQPVAIRHKGVFYLPPSAKNRVKIPLYMGIDREKTQYIVSPLPPHRWHRVSSVHEFGAEKTKILLILLIHTR